MAEPRKERPLASLDDPTIPVLTERLTLPALDIDFTLPPAPPTAGTARTREPSPAAAPPPADTRTPPLSDALPPAPAPSPAAAAPDAGTHWNRIERELRENILHDLALRLPQDVDSLIAARMTPLIDELTARVAQEVRLAIAASLRELVDRAVRAELDRLSNPRR
jgi:hypothetical protein